MCSDRIRAAAETAATKEAAAEKTPPPAACIASAFLCGRGKSRLRLRCPPAASRRLPNNRWVGGNNPNPLGGAFVKCAGACCLRGALPSRWPKSSPPVLPGDAASRAAMVKPAAAAAKGGDAEGHADTTARLASLFTVLEEALRGFALQKALESRGYSVFVGESAIRSGASWPTKIQKAVEDCSAFVVLCSTTYGDEAVSPRTARELDLADRLKKPLIPVWHSGPYPPKAVAIYLGGKQRIPTGILMEGYASAGISHERVADELAAALAHAGVRSADATAAEADAAAMAVVGAVAASKDASSNRSNAGGVETALCSPMHENVKAAPTESECTLQAGSEAILRLAVTIDGPESRCRAARARRRRASAYTHLS